MSDSALTKAKEIIKLFELCDRAHGYGVCQKHECQEHGCELEQKIQRIIEVQRILEE